MTALPLLFAKFENILFVARHVGMKVMGHNSRPALDKAAPVTGSTSNEPSQL
jgi:hypothetical protein